jgi:NADPH:quinone reductase-like Zn-dependent oxidoreductase
LWGYKLALYLAATAIETPAGQRVRWRRYDGQPKGSRLIRMAPWFDDGSLSVTIQARYSWHDAAQAHREMERGHTRGKIALIVDDDLAASLGV